MKADKILETLRKKNYKTVYWLEGDEDFFIDQVLNYAESHILSEDESAFNRTIIYGRDTDWATVMNACRRYPMFAERQVVIVKEAQAMRDIEKLEPYIDHPLSSTLLFIGYKGKKVDGRTKLAKTLKAKAEMLTTRKLYDNELPDWVQGLTREKGFTLTNKALYLLIDHIGNDLSRINNEIDKIAINLGERKNITEDDIEVFVGISKEYNVFELQDALVKRDLAKAIRIAQYFEHNPKAGPLQLIFPSIYTFFSKLQMIHTSGGSSDKALSGAIGVPEWKMKDYLQAAHKYNLMAIEKNILLLNQYNLRSLGVNDAGTEDGQLLKEMLVKMIQD
jgi:DNA polymerase III subunit delta